MESLVSELNKLVEKRAQELVKRNKENEDKFNCLLGDLHSLVNEAKILHEDMKANNLTVSSIESEGYLRFALTVEQILEDIES